MTSIDVGSDGRWLIYQIIRSYGDTPEQRALAQSDELFMAQDIFDVMATWDTAWERELSVAQSARCSRALRTAIEEHIRLNPPGFFNYLKMRQRWRDVDVAGSVVADAFALGTKRVRISTGASIPLVFAEHINRFMQTDAPAVLSGVVQAALSVIPGSGETTPWRPR